MGGANGPTVDLVKWLVPKLKAEGYKFVRVDQVPKPAQRIRDTEITGTPIDPPPPAAEQQTPASVDPCVRNDQIAP